MIYSKCPKYHVNCFSLITFTVNLSNIVIVNCVIKCDCVNNNNVTVTFPIKYAFLVNNFRVMYNEETSF